MHSRLDVSDRHVWLDRPLWRVPWLVREVQPKEQRKVGPTGFITGGIGGQRVQRMARDVDIGKACLRRLPVGAEACAFAARVRGRPVCLRLAPATRLIIIWRVARLVLIEQPKRHVWSGQRVEWEH